MRRYRMKEQRKRIRIIKTYKRVIKKFRREMERAKIEIVRIGRFYVAKNGSYQGKVMTLAGVLQLQGVTA